MNDGHRGTPDRRRGAGTGPVGGVPGSRDGSSGTGATGSGSGGGARSERRVSRAEEVVWPGDSRRGDRGVVGDAEFRSYYGRPIIKAPVWRYDIPAYLFTGGVAAGSALVAAGADLTGRPALRRAGRLTALGAIGASTYFLVNDLGRPARFHHMLRVAKPTSPMSVGTWILAAFGPAAGVAAVSEFASRLPWTGLVRGAGRVAGLAAAGLAPALATYTAVLLADTAVPSWHSAHPELPFVFAGSALAAAAGVGLAAAPTSETGPVRRLAVTGAALELVASHRVDSGMGLLSEPYRTGRAGRLLRASRALTVLGATGAVLGRRSRVVAALSGAALVAGSLATRFGVFAGGVASARDPKYTVVPQRERISRRTGSTAPAVRERAGGGTDEGAGGGAGGGDRPT